MADIYKTTAGLNVDDARNIKLSYLKFGSENFGYATGGYNIPTYYNVIDRFPFASAPVTSSDVGDLTSNVYSSAAQSSTTHGYASGGNDLVAGVSSYINTVQRFPFAVSTTNSTNIGTLTQSRSFVGGHSSLTHGYSSGGGFFNPFTPFTYYNIIDRFPFASAPVTVSDVGDMTQVKSGIASQTSVTHGYASGGVSTGGGEVNVIERFPFAVATVNSTDVGDLYLGTFRSDGTGHSSMTYGYYSGGTSSNTLDRFPFAVATFTNASTVGNVTQRQAAVGHSSVSFGYISAGNSVPGTPATRSYIDRFPFAASPASTSAIGDLTAARTSFSSTGQQY